MSTMHFHQTTSATPEQFIAALTDFGPGRSKVFAASDDEVTKVHKRGATEADVTEGTHGIWERLHYDWSDPRHVVLKTTDSNVWGGASGHTYTLRPRRDGRTDIDIDVVREGKNVKGRLIEILLSLGGKRLFGKGIQQSIRAIEARNKAR